MSSHLFLSLHCRIDDDGVSSSAKAVLLFVAPSTCSLLMCYYQMDRFEDKNFLPKVHTMCSVWSMKRVYKVAVDVVTYQSLSKLRWHILIGNSENHIFSSFLSLHGRSYRLAAQQKQKFFCCKSIWFMCYYQMDCFVKTKTFCPKCKLDASLLNPILGHKCNWSRFWFRFQDLIDSLTYLKIR